MRSIRRNNAPGEFGLVVPRKLNWISPSRRDD